MRSKWWGWGQEGESYHLPDPERFWSYVRSRLGDTEPVCKEILGLSDEEIANLLVAGVFQ